MKKITRLALCGIGMALPVVSHAKTINFHEANQGYAFYGGYSVLYYGQGAAVDTGNNVWNGFGNYPYSDGGPGSTMFYGGGNPDAAHGSVPAANPGNPYAWYRGTSTSGTTAFVPSSSPSNVPSANAWSDGSVSPIHFNVTFQSETGVTQLGNATTATSQGSPNKIFGEAATVSGATLGTFSLTAVPAGKYNLFLYGANYDGDRGATFALDNQPGALALGGFTATQNPGGNGSVLNTFILGGDYVEFLNVTPDSVGTISGTFAAVSNSITGQTGEGNFNGLQLVAVPEPTSFGLLGVGTFALLGRRRKTAK